MHIPGTSHCERREHDYTCVEEEELHHATARLLGHGDGNEGTSDVFMRTPCDILSTL